MGKARGNRAKNWLHQLRLLGEDKVGKNPDWVIIWRRVKENKSFIRIYQRIEWSWGGRPWKWDGDEYDHYKLMDTSKGERAKEKALRFQIRTEQRSSGGSPWEGRKLDSGFCAPLPVILPDLQGRRGQRGCTQTDNDKKMWASLRAPELEQRSAPEGASVNTDSTEGL